MAGRGGGREARVSNLDGKPPEEADFANYFCTYAFLYHQVGRVSPARSINIIFLQPLAHRKTCSRITSARGRTTTLS